jgi:hypothetical protein
MKRWTIATVGAACVLAGWSVAGCSAGSSGSAATSSPPAETPASATASPTAAATAGTIPYDVRFPMSPGRYKTVSFRPRFTFSTTVTAGGGAYEPDFANFSLTKECVSRPTNSGYAVM